MAAEIQRQDIITDDALAAPLQLAKNIDVAVASLGKLVKMSNDNKASVSAADSTTKLTKETNNLGLAQMELIKIQKQIATAQVKDNENYRTAAATLKAVKDATKEKTLIDKEAAKAVTASTASLRVLEDALKRNRQAYKDLTSEEQRNSKSGQELLKVIQSQDKALKASSATMGQHQANVGNYPKNFDDIAAAADRMIPGVDVATKGLGRFIGMATTLIKTPIGLAVAALAAAFGALSNFVKSTGEGEDALAKTTAVLGSIFKTLGDYINQAVRWLIEFSQTAVGGAIVAAANLIIKFNPLVLQFKLLGQILDKIVPAFKENARIAAELADELDNLEDAQRQYNIRASEGELKIKQLILASAKAGLTEQQRADKLQEALDIEIKLTEDELELKFRRLALAVKETEISNRSLKLSQQNNESLEEYAKRLSDNNSLIDENKDKIATALEEINVVRGKSDVLQEKIDNKSEKYAAAEEKRLQKIRDEHEKNAKAIKDAAEKAEKILIDNYNMAMELAVKQREREKKEREEAAKQIAKEDEDESKRLQDLYGKRIKDKQEQDAEAAAKALKLEQETARAREVLVQRVATLIHTLVVAESVDRIDSLNKQLDELSIAKDKELKEAGDNAAAKDKIERKYAAQQQALQKQIAKEKHDLAIKERDIAIANTIIHTAEAVVKGLKDGGLPLAILYGLIGAAELATIIATPIPQYAKGTKNHKGGDAIIGELGAELVKEPGKPWTLSPDKATLTTLAPGSKVITHDESMKILAMSALGEQAFLDRENRELQHEIKELRRDINRSTDRTVNAILSKGGEYFEQGTYTYRKQKKNDGSYQIIRLKNHPE